MRLKVCGMTRLDQVHALDKMGVQFAGFIFYHKSPRFVMKHMNGEQLKKAKLNINKVGVFVNSSYDEIMNHVHNFGLYMVQLHGDETPRFCERISDQVPTIKVFRIKEGDNIEWKIREYREVCDLFLFDTDWANYGGSGKKFDWKLLDQADIDKPFLLSGGIGLEDIDNLKEFASGKNGKNLFAVDVNSRFEISPGLKDLDKVKLLVDGLGANG
ncbi:MAG: phosphoribosylanthranilate isomerase [Bacteroidetes bacterium]|nr:MAG: phosphoribosylanthranilate isomerase [Bacteroidota bacterium]